jgi:uncharacterized repeat protein (TIGR03943 family)
VRRDIGGVLLILIGGAVLRITLAGSFLFYVKESTRPWLLISGVVLVVLGVLALVDVIRHPHAHGHGDDDGSHDGGLDDAHRRDDQPDGVPHDDGHGHAHPGAKVAWLLLVPVLTIFLVAPPALGAFTAERSSSSIAPPSDGDGPPPLPAGNAVPDLLSDYAARAVWDNGRTLEGRTVTLVGFVTPAASGGWYLTRLSLTCCAADAITVKILTVDPPSTPPSNSWVQVVGQWVPGGGVQSETAIPWVKVTSITPISAPSDPYE